MYKKHNIIQNQEIHNSLLYHSFFYSICKKFTFVFELNNLAYACEAHVPTHPDHALHICYYTLSKQQPLNMST